MKLYKIKKDNSWKSKPGNVPPTKKLDSVETSKQNTEGEKFEEADNLPEFDKRLQGEEIGTMPFINITTYVSKCIHMLPL